MRLAKTQDTTTAHPFGGCNKLLEQYRTIGRALVDYEQSSCAAFIPTSRGLKAFATSVSFVPVEVLETYLDDLLDLGVSDESLFIKKSKLSWRGRLMLGILGCALLGAASVWHGDLTATLMPALLAVTFLAGIGTTLYFLPRTKAIRRFRFATLVSREIGNRRGQDRNQVSNLATRFLMGDIWKLNDLSASRNLPPQAARVGVRYYH